MMVAIGIVMGLLALYVVGLLWFTDRDADLQFDFAELRRTSFRFGKDFLWGSATSAHQIEGNCFNNNWFQFESAMDEQNRPRIPNHQKAGAACDHWNRYEEDIQLMRSIGLNAYRFSVEWSKVEVEEGVFDDRALAHYEQEVDELRANGIEPMVTLHHFTNPIWFENRGAFLQDNSPAVFGRFIEKIVARLGHKVRFWCTINEPSVYAINGYFRGEFPPALKDPKKAARVLRNLLRSHTEAYSIIKRVVPGAQVGLALSVFIFDPPSRWNLIDVVTAHLINKNFNGSILRYLVEGKYEFSFPGVASDSLESTVRDSFDFVGLNYYTRFYERLDLSGDDKIAGVIKAPPEKLTDMNWEIYPEGLYRALKLVREYTSKPIYVTENGLADDSDTKRAKFIEDHLLVLNKAIADGINVKGYFYWSLMDNFEWAYGYSKRFGLYHVDFTTQERALRKGSEAYLEMIRKGRE